MIYDLYLLNDNIHSFEYVWRTLAQDIGLHPIQAEQCCVIVHHNKKVHIMRGTEARIMDAKEKLNKRNLLSQMIQYHE